MPCCHVGPAGPFAAQFKADAQRFSAYVGGAPNLPPGAVGTELVSALHVDLKLWQPGSNQLPLGRLYRINDAFGNAWKVARPQRTRDLFKGHSTARQRVENAVFALPQPPGGCVLSVFDQWILDTIIQIRALALSLAGGTAPARPYASSTVGMAQKILNVFLKYQACWHVGGRWDQGKGQFVNNPASATVAPFLCALHCPIDSMLLKALLGGPIGQELVHLGLMNKRGYLRQANGVFTSWSNLDCLKTYFGFQLILRRIAMRTWPPGCACQSVANHGNNSAAASNLPPKQYKPGEILDRFLNVGGSWDDDEKGPKKDDMPSDICSDYKKDSQLAVMKKRKVYICQQQQFLSLKWHCGDRANAGAISFDRNNFTGPCHVNSKISHAGGDLSLLEQIRLNGFEFFGPDFFPSRTGAVKGYGGGTGYIGYRSFRNKCEARRYLWQTGFIVRDCGGDCSQYWDFIDCLAEVLKLVCCLQQSDILVFKKETGKPKEWQKYREAEKLNGKEREHSEVSKDDGVGILDLLGTYSHFETTIRIYPEAIQECADDFGINQTDLTHLVILHELGHAFVHLGSSGNAVHSAYDLVECNRFWEQLEFFWGSEIHEFLAQSFTWIAVNDLVIRQKHPNLSGIFSKLIQSQPKDYKLWGRQNRPNDEQAWQASLTRARVALDEPSHWENCLRHIRDLMPANLDAAIKLFIKLDDSGPALVSRLFSKLQPRF